MDWTNLLRRHAGALTGLAATLLVLAPSGALGAQPGVSAAPIASGVAATLEACVTSVAQPERSATFSGEMTATASTAKMSMRIDLEERAPEEAEFHPVVESGLGVWRAADPKVKVYKYVRQVSNLSPPAAYRALVRFRWFNAAGHVIRRAERLTTKCLQPATPVESPAAPLAGGEAPASAPTTSS
jgi:hypothetical protein